MTSKARLKPKLDHFFRCDRVEISCSRSHIAASSLVIADTDDDNNNNNDSVTAAAVGEAIAAAAAATDNNNTKAMAHVYYSISLQDYVVTKADDLNANERVCVRVFVYIT